MPEQVLPHGRHEHLLLCRIVQEAAMRGVAKEQHFPARHVPLEMPDLRADDVALDCQSQEPLVGLVGIGTNRDGALEHHPDTQRGGLDTAVLRVSYCRTTQDRRQRGIWRRPHPGFCGKPGL